MLWNEVWVRLRSLLPSLVRRLPGGASLWALGALALATAAAGLAAGVTAYAPVLVLLPAAVGATSLLRGARRDRVVAVGVVLLVLVVVGAVLAGRGRLDATDAGVLACTAVAALVLGLAAEVWAARTVALETALQVARDTVDAVSVRDPLTGVANTHGLELVGRQIVETARRQGDAVHCTFVEVEGLDQARRADPTAADPVSAEAVSADAASDVLVALAEALRAVTRTTDVVARWRDATFCIVGQGTGVEPSELERRIRRRLGADDALDREVWSGRISAGGAMLPPWDAGTLETLLVRAAEELRARSTTRRSVRGIPPASSEVHERQAGEAG